MRLATLIVLLLAVAVTGTVVTSKMGWIPRHSEVAAQAKVAPGEKHAQVVGLGRVEPASEEVHVSVEIEGRLKEIRVEEGGRVHNGDVLAVLDNADYRARVELAEADVAAREAELERVMSGARVEERREAAAAIPEAEATLANARAELHRYQALYADGLTALEQVETRETAEKVAQARLEAARRHQELVDAEARTEDRDRAQAQLQLARARLSEVQALLDKTIVRSPISGTVLRRHFRIGETVPTGAAIVTLGDTSALRVRMELDERDVARVRIGQVAFCTADAFPNLRFRGRVIRVGQMLGRKNIRTDDPGERVDTRVLEVLIELEPDAHLPTGMRVDVFIDSDSPER